MTKYSIIVSKSYKKQVKKLNNKDKELLKEVVIKLANAQTLPPKYKDHFLVGDFKGYRECHIKPDLLLIYKIDKNILELYLAEVGSHSDIF